MAGVVEGAAVHLAADGVGAVAEIAVVVTAASVACEHAAAVVGGNAGIAAVQVCV